MDNPLVFGFVALLILVLASLIVWVLMLLSRAVGGYLTYLFRKDSSPRSDK